QAPHRIEAERISPHVSADPPRFGQRAELRPAPTMLRQRIILIVLLVWALAMIVPDLLRVAWPLGAYGFYANSDGLIYDVKGSFDRVEDSPAWKAGLHDGDQIDIAKLDCYPYDDKVCGDALTVIGGRSLVLPGRPVTLDLLASKAGPARKVTFYA